MINTVKTLFFVKLYEYGDVHVMYILSKLLTVFEKKKIYIYINR